MTNNKRYRLKKDLPSFEAGVECRLDQGWMESVDEQVGSRLIMYVGSGPGPSVDEWFEEIEPERPKRWRAKPGDSYWYISSNVRVELDMGDFQHIDQRRYETGDYFRTEAQALAVLEAYKALLEFVHDPEKSSVDLLKNIAKAREAVQKEAQ